ncbi:MAG: IS110 family transposase [Planctomycetes bacterium]|nr:IS110 family transposase [Planctomycetota bacterium]
MNTTRALYGGLDLHGDNVFCSLLDTSRRVVYERRLPNDLAAIREALEPYRQRIKSLAVESTYNWYWLVDGLRALLYDTRLANPARMQENIGLKAANDKTDARFIARQLVNGTLPEGYVYPPEKRGVRDMLRRRLRLVQARTAEWLSLEGLVARQTGRDVGIRELKTCDIAEVLGGDKHALAMAQASYRHIAFLEAEVATLEKSVRQEADESDRRALARLMTVPGIGLTLSRTIILETGPVSRFRDAGHYASYCRAVKSEHTSNQRKKGEGNGKAGNRYLGWAFVEAANLSVRHCPELRAWFQRKAARSGKRVIAVKALANKLAKACFFIMRDGTEFDVKRLVG